MGGGGGGEAIFSEVFFDVRVLDQAGVARRAASYEVVFPGGVSI